MKECIITILTIIFIIVVLSILGVTCISTTDCVSIIQHKYPNYEIKLLPNISTIIVKDEFNNIRYIDCNCFNKDSLKHNIIIFKGNN